MFRKILLILIGLCLAAVAIEVILRLKASYVVKQESPRLGLIPASAEYLVQFTRSGKRFVPNSRVIIKNHFLSKRDVPIEINSLGFRDQEISLRKDHNEVRILVLGDSITAADYLPADEIYVEQAEHWIRTIVPGIRIRFINGGISDVGIVEELDAFVERGIRVKPDIVILSFYLNDSRPAWGFPQEIGGRGWLRTHSLLAERAYQELVMRQWIQQKGESRFRWIHELKRFDWRRDHTAFLQLAKVARYDWGAAWEHDSWQVVDAQLTRLQELARQHDFKVAIVAFPTSLQVYAQFVEDLPERILKKKAERFGFYYLDLLPPLRTQQNRELFYDQCHPNTDGHQFIGKTVASFVAQQVLGKR